MKLSAYNDGDNTEASLEKGSRIDYPEREYTQASGSTGNAQKYLYKNVHYDIVISTWKHIADVKHATENYPNQHSQNDTISAKNVVIRSKKKDIVQTEKLNWNIKKNTISRMIDLITCISIDKRMLKKSMSRIENHTNETQKNMMSEERNCSENIQRSIGQDHYSTNMLTMARLYVLAIAVFVKENVRLMVTIQIMKKNLKWYGYAENVTQLYIGERLANSLENKWSSTG